MKEINKYIFIYIHIYILHNMYFFVVYQRGKIKYLFQFFVVFYDFET